MFISMHNINFITQFFLEILKRHSALVVLSTLGMPGHTHQQCHPKSAMKTIEIYMNVLKLRERWGKKQDIESSDASQLI